MIEKLPTSAPFGVQNDWRNKINELVDAVNAIQKEREAERFEIQEWIGILEAVRKSVNKHEDIIRQIGEWGSSKGECLWCANLTEVNLDAESRPENVQDKFAEQRKWIGKLCRFWNKTEYTDDIYGFLTDIVPTNKYKPEDNYFVPFKDEFGSFYEHCEPVKPTDSIIYRGGDNE